VAVVILLIAATAWWLRSYRVEKAVSNANLDYTRATSLFQQALFAGAPGSQERARSMGEAIRLAQDLRSNYPGTPAARMALQFEGVCHLMMGDEPGKAKNTEQAIAIFQQYRDTATDAEDKARGLLGLAAAYENRSWFMDSPQDMKEALAKYEETAKTAPQGSYLAYEAKMAMARLYGYLGEEAKAAQLYREIIKERGEEEKPEKKPADPTAQDAQREQWRRIIEMMLARNSYGAIAKQELEMLVPPSAVDLGLEMPAAAAK